MVKRLFILFLIALPGAALAQEKPAATPTKEDVNSVFSLVVTDSSFWNCLFATGVDPKKLTTLYVQEFGPVTQEALAGIKFSGQSIKVIKKQGISGDGTATLLIIDELVYKDNTLRLQMNGGRFYYYFEKKDEQWQTVSAWCE
jgi:hypothetical protein